MKERSILAAIYGHAQRIADYALPLPRSRDLLEKKQWQTFLTILVPLMVLTCLT